MGYWDIFDENLHKMEELDEAHKVMIKEKDFDQFEDEGCLTKIYQNRRDKTFGDRAVSLKKNISFFGIYCVGE
jgi:hypothetical protein